MSSPRADALFAVTGILLGVAAVLLIWQAGQNRPAPAAAPSAPLTSGASAVTAAASVPGALAAALRTGATPIPDSLQVIIGGMPQPYTERTAVPLSGDLMAEFALVTGEDRYQRVADIFIYRGTRDQPFDGATVKMTGEMRYMAHGYYTWVADPAGDGHYILPMPFNMPGEWKLTFQIDAGPKPTQVVLDLDLFY